MAKQGPLTDRQRQILSYIWETVRTNALPPTVREIGTATALHSTGAVSYQLRKLEREGYLEREKRSARGIRITEKARSLFENVQRAVVEMVQVPLVGDIVASEPVPIGHDDFAAYDADDVISLSSGMLSGRHERLFALRVRGDSMIDAMVNDGDVVILTPVHEVRDGQMVAARLLQEQETTLKYFHREGNRVRLQPANPTLGPIYTHAGNIEVQGRVVMVVRQVPLRP